MQGPHGRQAGRRFGWPLVLLALMALALLAPVPPPVVSEVTGAPVLGVSLQYPLTYVLLAPLCSVMDALTALSLRQHIAVLVAVLVIYALWRAFRLRKPERRHG